MRIKQFIVFVVLCLNCSEKSFSAIYDPLYSHHPDVKVNLTTSDLPIVKIDLNEKMAKKDEDRRVHADMKIIWRKDGGLNSVDDTKNYNYNGKIDIRYRGNTSYSFSAKKPFSFKTIDLSGNKQKVSLLGIPKDDDWVLMAPYNDRSLIRDALIFDLMRGTFEYVPEFIYCELILNGVYEGIYILGTRPRKGNNRFDIKKPTSDVGDGLTGGYQITIDHVEQPGFFGKQYIKDLYEKEMKRNNFFCVKYPDAEDITPAQRAYIENYVWDMERSASSENFRDKEQGYRAYLDTMSLMNYFISQEISKNIDGYRLSTPMYKYLDSKDKRLFFSIWDFNIAFGNADYADAFSTEGWGFNLNHFPNDGHVPWFFKRVLQDDVFYSNLRELWTSYRKDRLSDDRIINKIDSLAALLQQSQVRNFQAWSNNWGKQLWPNYYIPESWTDELNYLKSWILKRVAWIDSQWSYEVVNYVANSSLEAAHTRGLNSTNVSLGNWSTTGNVSLSPQNMFEGKYALSIKANSSVYQVITEVPEGHYDLKFYATTQRGPNAKVFIKYHDVHNQSLQIKEIIPDMNEYSLITFKNINVTNSFVELGFNVETTSGDVRLWVDAVEFVRSNDDTALNNMSDDNLNIRFIADGNSLTLRVLIDSEMSNGKELRVYDVYGKLLYSSLLYSNELLISNVFVNNQLYLIKIGNRVEKIMFK